MRIWPGVAAVLVGSLSLGSAALGEGAAADSEEDPPVLAPVTRESGQRQDPAQVAARLTPLVADKKLGKQAATTVRDAESGDSLFDDEGAVPLIPASTNKIPTTAAVLTFGDPDRRLTTKVTRTGNDLVLVGGGDPLLVSHKPAVEPGYPVYPAPTSLRALAKRTAAQLRGSNTTTVTLAVDDSFFEGPAWEPSWPEYYRTEGIVAPVSALIVDDGRVGGGQWAPISEDPAVEAGRTFAGLLRKEGIKVGGDVKRGRSGDGAAEVAAVESAPLFELVQQALTSSDNQTAENLFRLAGRYAGSGASFTGGSQAVGKALDQLGISTVMTKFIDGSGLSRDNRLTTTLLTDLLRRAVASEGGLWPIASGLPVAGVSGTLRGRFAAPETAAAAGWLRGKTGTLNYVSSLAGYVQSRSGRLLVFASLANDAKSTFEAGAQIDKIAAAAADCGCPGSGR